jgi:hypothetical protein
LIRKSLMSGPHLSDAARRAGPARQCVVAAWLPRATPTLRLKAAVGTARQPASLAPSPPDRAPLSASSPRLTRAVLTARSPGPKPPPRSKVDRHCPSAPTAVVRPSDAIASFIHGERHPSSPLAVLRPWSVELISPSLLTVAGPPSDTVAPPRRRNTATEPNFFSSPSTRSSGELAFRPPCPAGSLNVVGARSSPFAPSPRWTRPAQRAQGAPVWPWAVRPHYARGPS